MLKKGEILQERYKIEAVMVRRNQAILYKAYDEMLLQDVILKEYYPENTKNREMLTDEEKNLFIKETERFFGRYEWNGILQIKDRFEENDTVYLVLEFVAKRTVKEYLKVISQKQFDWNMAVKMFMPIIKMMSSMHAEGMLFGKVSIEDIWVREDGTCCLISTGENIVSEREDEEPGPWSDIYEICEILMELLKGKDIDEQIKQAILQGRNAEVQQRYFYFGIFLERLSKVENIVERSDLEEIQKLREKIQDIWGEKWLEITTFSERKSERKKKKFRMTKSRIRKLKLTAVLILVIFGVFAGFFIWKEKQPKTKEEILKVLEQSEPVKAEDGETVYNVSKSFAQEYDLVNNYENTFAVKKEELLSWLQEYYGIEVSKAGSTEWAGSVTVYEDTSRELSIQNYETISYSCSVQGKQLKAALKYDVVDDSVYSVEITADKEICREMMLELLPVLVPGAYLTEEEAESFLTYASENRLIYTYSKHGKYCLDLSQTMDNDNWDLKFYNYLRFEEMDEEMARAGNYERTSDKYKEFTEFLQNRSVSVETVENGMLYSLDESAVEEWGEACNEYLFDISADEIRSALTDSYGAELAKEDTIFEATVYEGGAIETFFVKREKYYCEDKVRIILVSDYISGKVNRLYVFDEENNEERAVRYMKEMLSLIEDDLDEDAENILKENLQEYRTNNAESNSFYMWTRMNDCSFMFLQVDDLAGICIQRILSAGYDYAPYNWP